MALKGTIMWDTRPTQANLSGYKGGGWGPACLQAHQAPPRLCPALAFDTTALMLHSVAAFVLQSASCTHYLLKSLQGLPVHGLQDGFDP